MSVYGYCYQNPVAYVDPNGKQAKVTDLGNGKYALELKVKFYNEANHKGEALDYIKRKVISGIKNHFSGKLGDGKISEISVIESNNATLGIHLVDTYETYEDASNSEFMLPVGWVNTDKIGNTQENDMYLLTSKLENEKGQLSGKRISTTGAHEMGHILGLRHENDSKNPSKVRESMGESIIKSMSPFTVEGNLMSQNVSQYDEHNLSTTQKRDVYNRVYNQQNKDKNVF